MKPGAQKPGARQPGAQKPGNSELRSPVPGNPESNRPDLNSPVPGNRWFYSTHVLIRAMNRNVRLKLGRKFFLVRTQGT